MAPALLGDPSLVHQWKGGVTSEARRAKALEGVVKTQAQLDAAMARWQVFRDQFRADRDAAVRRAIEEGVDKKEICILLGVTPQWLNKLLRGDAYRRSTD